MKRKRSILLFLLLLVQMAAPAAAWAGSAPSVTAHAYVVMDANSGEILLSQNQKKKVYPASAAKLMTAMVALDSLSVDETIKISEGVVGGIPKDASKLGLKHGSVYTVDELLHMLLIVSAADAADTLAVKAGGNMKEFVSKMNEKAKELGLKNTSFDNAIGLDIGNQFTKTYTTAEEFARIARKAMSYPQIREVVRKPVYYLPKRGNTPSQTLKNTNRFYSTQRYRTDLYTIIGSKTGTTRAAGHVLIAAARDAEGHEVICAFFGKGTASSTYADIRKLLDYIFSGNRELSPGFYDLWYRPSYQTILKYAAMGLLEVSEEEGFQPDLEADQKTFYTLFGKAAGINGLKGASSRKTMTAVRFIDLIRQCYPDWADRQDDNSIYEILCRFEVLPERAFKDPETALTREEMVLAIDKWLIENKNILEYPGNLPLAG